MYNLPDERGHFGPYGGVFVAETLVHALKELVEAAGLHHPSELRPHHIVRRVTANEVRLISNLLDFLEPGDLLEGRLRYPVFENFWARASADHFTLQA